MTLDFADVRPSLLNWAIVGMMALTFISFWKFVLTMWGTGIPGVDALSKLFASM